MYLKREWNTGAVNCTYISHKDAREALWNIDNVGEKSAEKLDIDEELFLRISMFRKKINFHE